MQAAEATHTAETPAPAAAPPVATDAAAAPAKPVTYTGPGGGTPAAANDAVGHYADAPITPEQLIARMNADVAKINNQVAEAKAKELAELAIKAHEEDQGFATSLIGGMKGSKADFREELERLPPEMRKLVVEKMGALEGKGVGESEFGHQQTLDADAIAFAKETATEVTEQEIEDKKRAEERKKKIDGAVAVAESGDPKAIARSIDNMRDGERESAMKKMSPEAREAFEEELDKRRKRLERAAQRLRDASAGAGTNEITIVAELSKLSPREAEELSDVYGEMFKDGKKSASLAHDLKDEFKKGSKQSEFITAALNGEKEAKQLSLELTVEYLKEESDAIFNSSESGMNDLLRAHGRTPEDAQALSEHFKAVTGKDLSAACSKVMNDEEYKEATAYQRGDMRTANVAVVEQGDPDRTEQVVDEVKDEGKLGELTQDLQEHTGKKGSEVLAEQLPPEKQAAIATEVTAAEDKIKAERDAFLNAEVAKLKPEERVAAQRKADDAAAKLLTALSKGHYVGNNFDVTQHLVGLSPAEVKLTMDSYRKQAESAKLDNTDLEADLREKLDGKDLKVANAALSGNKVLTAVALMEQSGDGAFTNVDMAKKAMATLDKPEDRKAFLETMNKHVGGVKGDDAMQHWLKAETSSFERDELAAMSIVDEDERAATMAQVEISKNAYGGKYAQMIEGLHDEIGGMTGETDEERRKRRQTVRESDMFVGLSNLGAGSDDKIVDATASMKNERQLALLHEKSRLENGEELNETLKSELSQGRLSAAEKFAGGDFEGGQAEQMVGALTDMQLDDKEDRASLAFEQVRIPAAKQAELAKIKDPVAREQAIEAAKKEARESLHARVDEVAREKGYASYLDMLEKEGLTPAELAVAKERIADGKVSDHTALLKAGDTAVGNLGKDSGKFYEIMGDKTPEQMAKLEKDFEAANPGVDFHEWVLSKAGSAGERRDFQIMLEGNYARMSDKDLAKKAAEDPRALIKRVKDLHEAARGGADHVDYDVVGNFTRKVGNELGNDMADEYGNTGARIDGRLAAVQQLEAKLDAGEQLSAEEQEQLITHMRYMAGDQQGYTETKNEVVDATAEVAGTVVEVGTVALTGSDTAGAVTGGLTKMGVKANMNAGRFSGDDVIAGGAEILGDVAGGALAKGKNPITDAALEGAIGGLAQTAGDTKNWNDAGRAFENGVTNVVQGTASGVAGAGIEVVGGDGVISKVAQAGADELITGDPSKSGGERLVNVAKSAAKDVATSKAENHYKNRNSDPTVTVRDATDEERREVEAAVAEDDAAAKPEQRREATSEPKPEDTAVSTHPIADVEGDPTPVDDGPQIDAHEADAYTRSKTEAEARAAERTSAFGDEGTEKGKRVLEAKTEHGSVKAKVVGDKVNITFPDGMSADDRRTFARDALDKLGLDATDDAIEAQLGEGTMRIGQQLHVARPEDVANIARDIFMTPEQVAAREGDTPESLTGKCEVTSEKWQAALAERGIHVPIINAENNKETGRYGHKFMVVGDVIIDPTIAQFMKGSDKPGANEPFIGTYTDLEKHIQAAIDEGRMPEYQDADEALSKQWGIQPGKEPGTFELDSGVKPLESKGIVPKTVEETRRYMEEQRAAGIEPGQGLPPALVEAANAKQRPPVPRYDGPKITATEMTPTEHAALEAERIEAEHSSERAELDVQPNPDPRLKPVDLEEMKRADALPEIEAHEATGANKIEAEYADGPELSVREVSDEVRRMVDNAVAVHEDAPEIEANEATADEQREVDRAAQGARPWEGERATDIRRKMADALDWLGGSEMQKDNEAVGGVLDDLAVDKLNPVKAPDAFGDMKNLSDGAGGVLAVTDVLKHWIDPTRLMADVNPGQLANAMVAGASKLGELAIKTHSPEMADLFSKMIDHVKVAMAPHGVMEQAGQKVLDFSHKLWDLGKGAVRWFRKAFADEAPAADNADAQADRVRIAEPAAAETPPSPEEQREIAAEYEALAEEDKAELQRSTKRRAR